MLLECADRTLLIETAEHYVSHNSTAHVYILLIDASKDFDRLCHELLESHVCPLV